MGAYDQPMSGHESLNISVSQVLKYKSHQAGGPYNNNNKGEMYQ